MAKLKFISSTEKEFKELQEAYLSFSKYFVLNIQDEGKVWVESMVPMAETLEGKILHFNESETKGVKIYPEKEKEINGIIDVGNGGMVTSYPIFWLDSKEDRLTLGLGEEKNRKYLFEIHHKTPKYK